MTDHGAELLDVSVGPGGVLTGSARISQEAKEKSEQLLRQQEIERKQFELETKRKALEAKIALLQAEFEAEEAEALKVLGIDEARVKLLSQDRLEMAMSRKGDTDKKTSSSGRKKNK